MAVTNWIEKLGRAVFEGPFDAIEVTREAPELAEIRLAVLDEVKRKSRRAGGREVFLYNLVRIHLRGTPADRSTVFEGSFFARFLEQEVKVALARANCRFPDDLAVAVETSPELPGSNEPWLRIEIESRPAPPEEPVVRRIARLVVLKGTASQMKLSLRKVRTNIGRTADVYRADGPSRRNDLAFSEDSEINRTVSREHAHIVFHKKAGEYRLFNDRWHKPGIGSGGGLWILRDGLSQEVHRDARGVRLQHGDEIHLGRAVVQFQLG